MCNLGNECNYAEAVVSYAHPVALEAAKKILLKGGSAIDAVIAADAVLGVVEPMATSIGGDVLALIYEPKSSRVISYNGTGRSPSGLDPSLVKSLPGQRIPERHPLSVTVPGAVRGWQDLHDRYGKLSWPELFEDAIRCARNGYRLGAVAAREWGIFDFVLHEDSECRRVFNAGRPPKANSIQSNPDLGGVDRKSTRLNSSHVAISYAVFCLILLLLPVCILFPYTTLFRSPELFEDAIRCARNGYRLGAVAAREWGIFDFVLHEDSECRRVFNAGRPPKANSIQSNPDLGGVLEKISREGADGFYYGWIPKCAAEAVQSHGGVLVEEDFAQHKGFFTRPLKQSFFGYEVYQCPPNTHGVSILRALRDIEEAQIKPNSPEAWLFMVQATERALAYARETVSDPGGNTVCTVIKDGKDWLSI